MNTDTILRITLFVSLVMFSCGKKPKGKSKDTEKHLYLTSEGAEKYVEMAKDYNGSELIDKLKKYLKKDSSVLELGMGPGTDLDILKHHYQATGSDYSQAFLDRYQAIHASADLLLLDAAKLATNRKFDGIYSNKVLHHLTHEDLQASIKRQAEILNPQGIVCHSFWKGSEDEKIEGLYFHYLTLEKVRGLFDAAFEILEINEYEEMDPGDSIYILARRKSTI